jgi:hypothetical protein
MNELVLTTISPIMPYPSKRPKGPVSDNAVPDPSYSRISVFLIHAPSTAHDSRKDQFQCRMLLLA